MFVFVFIICFLILYVTLALKKKTDFTIIQTSIENIHDDILFEKYPIVINSKLVSSEYLLETLFKYLYIKKEITHYNGDFEENKVRGKYNIIHNESDKKMTINVRNDNESVDIILNSHSVLILPSRWYFKSEYSGKVIQLFDIIHYLF